MSEKVKERGREGVKERKRKEKVYTDIQRARARESERVRGRESFDTVHVHAGERSRLWSRNMFRQSSHCRKRRLQGREAFSEGIPSLL